MPDLKYDAARTELVPFLPAGARSLLDVGAGTGTYAADVRKARPDIQLWAVEPDVANADAARPHFDQLVVGSFPAVVDELPLGAFDAITFNDVLEHMVEPAVALDAARLLLTAEGVVIASIPNVRHRSVLWPLLRRAEWHYEETGLLDRTHLRFFTRPTMIELFTSSGWSVVDVAGINRRWHWRDTGERRRMRLIRRLTRGRLDDFFFVQYVITARPA